MKSAPASILLKKACGLATIRQAGLRVPEPNRRRSASSPGTRSRDREDQARGHEHHGCRERGAQHRRNRAQHGHRSRLSTNTLLVRQGADSSGMRPARQPSPLTVVPGVERRNNMASKLAKKRKAHSRKVDRDKRYTLDEAVDVVKKAAYAKFDESVDIAVRLGVNPKHADQMVRGAIVLPHGTGKSRPRRGVRQGRQGKGSARSGRRLRRRRTSSPQKVQEGILDFDRVIATPDMMGAVGKLGRILGPRGLMPNPKVGTVTMDVGERRARGQGWQGRVPCRQGGRHSLPHRPGVVRAAEACRERPALIARAASPRSHRRPRASISGASPLRARWARACASTPPVTATPRRKPDATR